MSYKREKQKFDAEGVREGFGEKQDVGRENTWHHRQGSEQGPGYKLPLLNPLKIHPAVRGSQNRAGRKGVFPCKDVHICT